MAFIEGYKQAAIAWPSLPACLPLSPSLIQRGRGSDPAVTRAGKTAGKEVTASFPLPSGNVSFSSQMALWKEGAQEKPLASSWLRACPGAPLRRWEISLPCQTTWLLGGERASHTAPRLQTFIRTAFSTFRAFMGWFFFIPSSTYELTNISRMESCCKLRAPKIYHHVFDNLGTFLSLQMYAFVHIFFSYSLKSALIVTRSGFQ